MADSERENLRMRKFFSSGKSEIKVKEKEKRAAECLVLLLFFRCRICYFLYRLSLLCMYVAPLSCAVLEQKTLEF